MQYVNKIILTFPRSGSKLLAKIYKDRGYHNFGEFFNTFSSLIITDDKGIPRAVRSKQDHQRRIRQTRVNRGGHADDWSHILASRIRFEQFKNFKDLTPSILTLWPMTIDYLPDAFSTIIENREILCLRRSNKFDQLLSRCITVAHSNHDNETKSQPFKVERSYFEFTFFALLKLEKMQDDLIKSGKGKLIMFDDLINGNANLGFEYNVDTEDQHKDLESLILNLEEIKELYQNLKDKFGIEND